MASLTKNQIILILGIAVILGGAYLTGILEDIMPFAVIGLSQNVELGDDGKFYTIAQVSPASTDLATFKMKQGNQIAPDGTRVESNKEVVVTLRPAIPKVNYRLNPKHVRIGGFTVYTYYELGIPEREQSIKVSTSTSTQECVFNNFDTIGRCTIKDSDGKGFAEVSASGGFVAKEDIPQGNLVVLNNNGVPRVVDKLDYQNSLAGIGFCFNPLTILQCQDALGSLSTGSSVPTVFAFSQYYQDLRFTDPSGTELKTKIAGVPKSQELVRPVVIITAEENFFDSVRFSPEEELVTPQLVSFTSGDAAEGTTRNYILTVKNPSSAEKTFSGTMDVSLGAISPESFTIRNIPPYSQGQVTFTYTAPSVSSKTPNTYTVEVCEVAQTGSLCAGQSYSRNILDVPETIIPTIPPVPYCGDGSCDLLIGETFVSCPSDCESEPPPTQVDCATIENSREYAGECVCNSGFARVFDSTTGEMKCTEPEPDYLITALWGVLTLTSLAVLYLLYERFIKKKRGRK